MLAGEEELPVLAGAQINYRVAERGRIGLPLFWLAAPIFSSLNCWGRGRRIQRRLLHGVGGAVKLDGQGKISKRVTTLLAAGRYDRRTSPQDSPTTTATAPGRLLPSLGSPRNQVPKRGWSSLAQAFDLRALHAPAHRTSEAAGLRGVQRPDRQPRCTPELLAALPPGAVLYTLRYAIRRSTQR